MPSDQHAFFSISTVFFIFSFEKVLLKYQFILKGLYRSEKSFESVAGMMFYFFIFFFLFSLRLDTPIPAR
jgi:hypothetical protein